MVLRVPRWTFNVILVTIGSVIALNGQSAPNRTVLEKQAKAISEEAKALAGRKQYAAARDRYVDAQGIAVTNDATTGLARVAAELGKQTKKLLESAEKEFVAGRAAAALTLIDEAEKVSPHEASVHYNAAIVLLKLGRDEEATARLERAASLTADPGDRRRFLEMRSAATTHHAPARGDTALKDRLEDLNQRMEDSANFEDVCRELTALQPSLRDDPNVLLNLARCAEGDGRLAEAMELFDAYLKLAPTAVDSAEVRASTTKLSALTQLPGDVGEVVRGHYGQAAQLLRRGLYAEAIQAYGRAEAASPAYAETQWRLATLHQAVGNQTDATARYERYLAMETDPARSASARSELEAMSARQTTYNERTGHAEEQLLLLLNRVFVLDEPIGTEYGQREMIAVEQAVEEALALVPLGLKANALSALSYLIGNNYEAAKHSYLAVRDKGAPVVFFAEFTIKGGAEVRLRGKAEVTTEQTLVIVPAARYDKSTKKWMPAPGAREALGSYVSAAAATSGVNDERFTIKASDIRSVETDHARVEVTHARGSLVIVPKYLASFVPAYGPVARRHANAYTRLLRDFLPFKTAKLGKESMTMSEKFDMVMSVAAAAYGSYGMTSMYGISSAAQRITAVSMSVRDASQTLQQGMIRQRELLRASRFRLVPTEIFQPQFRAELFR